MRQMIRKLLKDLRAFIRFISFEFMRAIRRIRSPKMMKLRRVQERVTIHDVEPMNREERRTRDFHPHTFGEERSRDRMNGTRLHNQDLRNSRRLTRPPPRAASKRGH